MKRFILAAGVAALAITAPAAAKPGGGHGHAEKAQRGGAHGGGAHARAAQRGSSQAKARASRGGQHAARTTHAPKQRTMRMAQAHGGQAKAKPHAHVKVAQSHGNAHAKAAQRKQAHASNVQSAKRQNADRNREAAIREMRSDRRQAAVRDIRNDRRQAIRDVRNDRSRQIAFREADRDQRRARALADRRWINADYRSDYRNDFRYDSCPPGLAAKHNGCMPPGQARKLIGNRLPDAFRSSYLPVSLRDYYRDNDDYYYRYGDGYLYRVQRQNNLVAALLPLFGGGLGGIGTPFPAAYSNYAVPSYYQPFYPDYGDNYYRYANGYVYDIDRGTGLIQGVVPLMAGGYGVGQVLPAGYSTYNLPYQYRDYYPDTSDYYYRYAPGAIYQVDPRTSLVTSVASLLTPTGFAVGQQMPLGYGAYNVPYPYRDHYYDTADNWYRYNNGYIYQVDPTTQLISAVIQAIV
jgi:hypothetical protein